MNSTTPGTVWKWNHTAFVFCDWFISFGIMSSRYIHVVTYVKISFLISHCIQYLPNCVSPFICGWMLGSLSPFSFCEQCCYEHGCINTWVPTFNSFGYTPRSGVAGSYHNSDLIFWGTAILFPTMAIPLYIPTNSTQDFNFSEFSSTPRVS